jgi:hypothetical protein
MSTRAIVMTRADCWARIVRLLDHWPDIPTMRAVLDDWDWSVEDILSLVWLAEGERP